MREKHAAGHRGEPFYGMIPHSCRRPAGYDDHIGIGKGFIHNGAEPGRIIPHQSGHADFRSRPTAQSRQRMRVDVAYLPRRRSPVYGNDFISR